MSATLNSAISKVFVEWNWSDAKTLGNTLNAYPRSLAVSWVNGSGAAALEVNKIYADRRTVTAGTPLVLNLTDGSLKDWAQNAVVFTKLKDLHIELISGPTLLKITAAGNTFRDALYGAHANSVDELTYPGGAHKKLVPTVAGLAVGADGTISLSCSTTNAEVDVILIGVG